jgi:23S rRNA pseudouridine2605 synthase
MKKSKFTPTRLNKYLAQAGIASRRKADEMITQGRVSIGGKTIRELGLVLQEKPKDLEVDGSPVEPVSSKKQYFAFYKPKNVVTTMSDPEDRPCVGDFIRKMDIHLFPIGRLDFDAEGILILTNDGELAHKLSHPSFGIEKKYEVKVKGKPSGETIEKLKRGLKLEDGFVKPTFVKVVKLMKENSWIDIRVTEGRNHLIKRIWLRLKHPVIKLVRSEFAGIKARDLKPGQIKKLQPKDLSHLLDL